MIIDLILDRYETNEYNARKFYNGIMMYEEGTDYLISRVLDNGTNEDVQKALCNYVITHEYNPKICDYINSVTWVED